MISRTSKIILILFVAAALGNWPAVVTAQSTFGSVLGTIQDASGGAIAGAGVTVRNLSDNTTRTALSDESGQYQILNLQPGTYEVVASKEGFTNATLGGALLDARQQLRVDLKLEVAGVKQSVTVEDAVSAINTEKCDTLGF